MVFVSNKYLARLEVSNTHHYHFPIILLPLRGTIPTALKSLCSMIVNHTLSAFGLQSPEYNPSVQCPFKHSKLSCTKTDTNVFCLFLFFCSLFPLAHRPRLFCVRHNSTSDLDSCTGCSKQPIFILVLGEGSDKAWQGYLLWFCFTDVASHGG